MAGWPSSSTSLRTVMAVTSPKTTKAWPTSMMRSRRHSIEAGESATRRGDTVWEASVVMPELLRLVVAVLERARCCR